MTRVQHFSRKCHEFFKIPHTSSSQEYQATGWRERHVALTRPEKFFLRGFSDVFLRARFANSANMSLKTPMRFHRAKRLYAVLRWPHFVAPERLVERRIERARKRQQSRGSGLGM
jgi:hypothetical protein